VLVMIPMAFRLREPAPTQALGPQQSSWQATRAAFGNRPFQLLLSGYFVCGFQVVFIGVHLPAYLKDKGIAADVAPTALALIGLFNIFGTYLAGSLGQRFAKRHLLSGIYFLRAVAITAFIAMPISATSVYVFAAVIGFLWLSTVPPTNAIVAQVFGVQHMSMLGGFVFLSHQVGSFLGVWLGGRLYDATGSYDLVWWIAIALGIFAALVNLPVRETPILRTPEAAAVTA
jgi:predicted MFS family arabinose efflux permease